MIIRSLKLKNIRSYPHAEIDFDEGTTLLAGDIGAGKSTILLAIEFAIFGIMKGVLSGTNLLRQGAISGTVELKFQIEEKEIVIRRSLKRGAVGVAQDSGSIMMNGRILECTTQELKSIVLELLGYPEELLTKSKSLIFRYTVFTPQEEMKKILLEPKEERLDILRSLFDIDRYKRIRENANDYSKDLKNKANFLQGSLSRFDDKKRELASYRQQTDILSNELKVLAEETQFRKSELDQATTQLKKMEQELEESNRLDKEFSVMSSEQEFLKRQLETAGADLKKIKDSIEELLKVLSGYDLSKKEEISTKIERKKEELKDKENKISEVMTRQMEYRTRKNSSEKMIQQITDLDVCPTCRQKVSQEHISDVKAREMLAIHNCDANLAKLKAFEKQFKESAEAIKSELDNYVRGERAIEGMKTKLEFLDEKKSQKIILEGKIADFREKMNIKAEALEYLRSKLNADKGKRIEVETNKVLVKRLEQAFNELQNNSTQARTRLEMIGKLSHQLNTDIEQMENDREKLSIMTKKRTWLESDFIKLVEIIEKNMLARVYHEFNTFFQEWFNTLIEDETMSVRLDGYFSPVIEQNGYETAFENLSGGERTSVALAYRLALNKVLNDFLTTIKTRELIILDEPTEGFSTEQLDRVREVLRQTNARQTIIVSHEPKMEGYVDKIVRVRKQNHESEFA